MAQTLVYHGSQDVVSAPLLAKCRPRNDYGRAFYCTFDEELAMEWACEDASTDGFVNTYSIDLSTLKVLDLDTDPKGVLAWIAVLLANRPVDMEWNAAQEIGRFVEAYSVDLTGFDAVTGYRADDSYFSIARAFASGAITDLQLAEALRLGDLGRQIAFRTQRAVDALAFEGAQRVEASIWGLRRLRRDKAARDAFRSMKTRTETEGLRIYELSGKADTL